MLMLYCAAVWTNPNAGKAKNLTIGYHTGDNTLFFSGDLDAFNEANGNAAIPVVRLCISRIHFHKLTPPLQEIFLTK